VTFGLKPAESLDAGHFRYAMSWFGDRLAGEGRVLDVQGTSNCCDRCASMSAAARIARRRILQAAVFRLDQAGGEAAATRRSGAGPGSDRPGELPRSVTGRLVEAGPQSVVIGKGPSELPLKLTAGATAWRGGPVSPEALRPGDLVVVRLHPSQRGVADRIWSNIGRVTGTIIERQGNSLMVDAGLTRERQFVVVPSRAASQIQVRYPNLKPDYLIDVIGLRGPDHLEALVPATPQPAYRVSRLPAPPPVNRYGSGQISGSVTWREPDGEPYGVLGAAYPALDPETGCAEEHPQRVARGFVRMPYLSVGSLLRVRNDCSGAERVLPVTGCAPIARLFNDRCLTCGTSPRGRIAELTLASFVALGGELERGCFNATIATAGR
jgi:hypothetical protein